MPVGSITPFRPTGTVSISASTISSSVQLLGGGDTVVVTNTTSALAYVRFGADPTVSASTGDMPILSNSRAVIAVNSLIGYAAVILISGNGTVLLTRGDGSFL